jgi:phosphohistidine phosphatase
MKKLLLMRHGKSSWKDDGLSDHERSLKKRGRKDSKAIAKVIQKHDLLPDIILSSTATRARETAAILAETLELENRVHYFDELYMAEPQELIDLLKNLNNENTTAMIVGHNPGLEAYLQIIDGEIEALPTAGLGSLVLAIDEWQDLTLEAMGDLVGFWKPKDLEEKKKTSKH